MKRVALQKATEHLELAKAAVDQMKQATNFNAYERAWSQFLSQASRIYNKIEQGAKGCNASEPWFGNKKHERRKDPLLSYIHHARDCEEHTIDHTAAIAADGIMGLMENDGDFSISCDVMVDENGRQHYRNIVAKGPDGEDLPYELINAKLALLTVRDKRYGDKFAPPAMHRAHPIVDTTPRGVAQLALTYMEEMLNEAAQFPMRY